MYVHIYILYIVHISNSFLPLLKQQETHRGHLPPKKKNKVRLDSGVEAPRAINLHPFSMLLSPNKHRNKGRPTPQWTRLFCLKVDSIFGRDFCRWHICNVVVWHSFQWKVWGQRQRYPLMEQNSLKQLGWLYVHIDPMRYIYIYIFNLYIHMYYMYIMLLNSRRIYHANWWILSNMSQVHNVYTLRYWHASSPTNTCNGNWCGDASDLSFVMNMRNKLKQQTNTKDNHMDVSKNRGTPKWLVYNGKPY